MKSLKTVMNITKVFKILAIIATVGTFLCAVGCFLGALIIGVLKGQPEFVSEMQNMLAELGYEFVSTDVAISTALTTTVYSGITLIGSGVCLILSVLLLSTVEKQRTPFSKPVVKTARTYGIIFIAVTIITNIIGSIASAIITAPNAYMPNGNYGFLTAGIALIITSFFIDYGADLRTVADSVPVADEQPADNAQNSCNDGAAGSDGANGNASDSEDLFD